MNDYVVKLGAGPEFLNLDVVMGNNLEFKSPKQPHESDWAEENTKYSVEQKYKMVLLHIKHEELAEEFSYNYCRMREITEYLDHIKKNPDKAEIKKLVQADFDEAKSEVEECQNNLNAISDKKNKIHFEYLAVRDSN